MGMLMAQVEMISASHLLLLKNTTRVSARQIVHASDMSAPVRAIRVVRARAIAVVRVKAMYAFIANASMQVVLYTGFKYSSNKF